MPVYKFRSVEDMPEAAWRAPGDATLYRSLVSLSEMCRRLNLRRFPAGVYKHRSMAEMNAQRDRWDAEHVAHTRNRSATPSSA